MKKILSILLALLMALSLIPVAFADSPNSAGSPESDVFTEITPDATKVLPGGTVVFTALTTYTSGKTENQWLHFVSEEWSGVDSSVPAAELNDRLEEFNSTAAVVMPEELGEYNVEITYTITLQHDASGKRTEISPVTWSGMIQVVEDTGLTEEKPLVTQLLSIVVSGEAYLGFGLSSNGRIGPGKDDKQVQVYSINQVFASAIFDAEGRILFVFIDQLEVATPNYDGATMPHFSGFPGQGGYSLDQDHDAKTDGISTVTDDTFMTEIASWLTKRQRGADYAMGTGTWSTQMDKYQQIFTGMTMSELDKWFVKYSSDRNGRLLKPASTNEQDAAKYIALSDEDKAMLADVTTAATMNLRDTHGDIIAALWNAYDNRLPLLAKSAAGFGFGIANSGRIGPGKDNQDVQVYSLNEVYAVTLFDAEGRIAAIHADQLEVATPNYDGASMPHFSGFPGQTAYNNDIDHDAKIDSKASVTDDTFMAEIASWLTKRDRGADYVMGTGIWSTQMDKYQEIFIGMTVAEAEAWFVAYCSDRNGRVLKADSANKQDLAKYAALTDEEKDMLVDVTTTATMSLRDGHGDILAAIRASFTNRIAIELTAAN